MNRKMLFGILVPMMAMACAPAESEEEDAAESGEDELRAHPSKPAGAPTLPDDYESLRATDKQRLLGQLINRGQYCPPSDSQAACLEKMPKTNLNYYFRAIPAIFSLRPTFHHTSDEAPEGRRKIFHPFGVAGEAEIVFDYERAAPYSGLFKNTGQRIPLVLRLAPGGGSGMIPGASVKFLIDGKPARNFVAIHDFNGLPDNDWNYFTQEIGHIYPDVPWLLKKYFQTQTNDPSHLPINHLTDIEANGREVPAAEQKTPYEIRLRPAREVATRFPNTDQHDFRLDLLKIEPGTPVYDIVAREKESDTTFETLGTIKTTSRLVASIGGDSQLYFKHSGAKK